MYIINNNVNSYYKYFSGTLILVCGGDTESAWCLSNDAYPFTNYLAETQSILPLDSPAWAMEEIIGDSAIHIEKQSSPQGEPPLLVRQHMEPPRKFIFLTAQVRAYDRHIFYYVCIK